MPELPESLLAIGDNRDNIRRLVAQVKSEAGIVPFVGMGLSIGLGFPSWQDFLTIQATKLDDQSQTNLIPLFYEQKDLIAATEYLMNERGKLFFLDLQRAYDSTSYVTQPIKGAMAHLPKISTKIITFALDKVLEKCYQQQDVLFDITIDHSTTLYPDTSTALSRIPNILVSLNGSVDDVNNVILTKNDIEREFNVRIVRGFGGIGGVAEPILYQCLKYFFSSKSVFFVGYSFQDLHILKILKESISEFRLPKHFAVLPELSINQNDVYNMGIYPIWYPDNEDGYIEKILAYLVEQKQGSDAVNVSSIASVQQTAKITVPVPLPALVEACATGQAVAFVGSGLTAPANLPTWKPFVKGLIQWAGERGYLPDSLKLSLDEALESGAVDSVADEVINALPQDPGLLAQYLGQVFVQPFRKIPPGFRTLSHIPFSAVLTTNFDDLLERTYSDKGIERYTPQDAEQLLEAQAQGRFFLLKLYGTVERPETLMVSPAQFQDALAQNPRFANVIETLFVSQTILFLGVSLEGIENYLSGIRFKSNPNRRHFALLNVENGKNGAWRVKADQLERRYGIQVIPYQATEGFPEVEQFVNTLYTEVEQFKNTQQGVTLATNPPARLTQISLENIGPFKNLTLSLNSSWQMLLGDNGVGKSSILKAIALAVCGEDARHLAHRLIRIGSQNATITLETDKGTKYVTQILRGDGEAEIVSRPGRFLETEKCLVLGFPPLRGITWTQYRDDIKTFERPTTEDVLPILRDEMDSRLDRLKQWLLRLDHLIQDDKAKGIAESPFEQLRTQFFDIVKRLTPGVNIEFVRLDPSSRQVTVRTNDGEIPIEAVSQGTASLLAWIGILMQRLYDVYRTQGDPLQRYALVLIDEIDAHMHPFWQQFVIPVIQETFPNVQFVATTHSPLIVGDLKPEQITVLERDAETSQIVANSMGQEISGLRADQILTSSLFRLQSTRSKRHQEKVRRYADLLSLPERTVEQQQEYSEIRSYLLTQTYTEERVNGTNGYVDEDNSTDKNGAEERPPLTPEQKEELKKKMASLLEE